MSYSSRNERKFKSKIVSTSKSQSFRSGDIWNIEKKEDKKKNEKKEILRSIPSSTFFVGIEPLSENELESLGHKLTNSLVANIVKAYLPSPFGKYWYHSSIFVPDFFDQSIGTVIEYGGYEGPDEKYEGNGKTTHYFKNDGLRMVKMETDEYIYKKIKYKKGWLEDKMPFIELHSKCDFSNIEEILEKCGSNWNCLDYDLANHNCQDFVAKFIEVTKAIRKEGEYFRGYHNAAKLSFPWKILSEIEKNEDDTFCKFEKVPIIGTALTSLKVYGNGIYKLFH